MPEADPVGLRVLVVEDEFLLGMALEDDLREAGFLVIGPMRRLATALEAARTHIFDLALLDINLAGEQVYPLADELIGRGTPFLFLSGYAAADMPERFHRIHRLAKPYDPASLIRAVRAIGKASAR